MGRTCSEVAMTNPWRRRVGWTSVAVGATAVLTACGAPEPERVSGPAPRPSVIESRTPAPSLSTPPEVTATPSDHGTPGDIRETTSVATGLQTPWGVAFLPDGSALVTLRDSGEVLRVDDRGQTRLSADGPGGAVPAVHHESEDGLLGIAIGPDRGVYLYLTTDRDNRVVRYNLDGDDLVDPTVIIDGIPSHQNHNGGRLAFGPDGYLYVTTGDARQEDRAQDTDSLAGKILRLTPTGDPAPGNPFGNAVWSYGHRNVQGIGWTSDGRMYASEFGTSEFDELNLIEPGGNYGWPDIEGWAGRSGFIDPLVTWPTDEASPSGITVTDEGVWMTALRGETLWFIPLDPGGEVGEPRRHRLGIGRLRDVVTAPDGSLWVMTSNTDGRGRPKAGDDRILRLVIRPPS